MPDMFETEHHALAYLIGVYLSDGFLRTYTRGFGLGVSDEVFRDETAKALDVVGSKYGLGTRPQHLGKDGYNGKRHYQLWECSPYKVGWWLDKLFHSGKDHLPEMPDQFVRDLVAGILDGDGSIWRYREGYLGLSMGGISDYLADLQKLFKGFGVIMHFRPGRMNHVINLRSFTKAGFYFRMPRKQALVEEYITKFVQ